MAMMRAKHKVTGAVTDVVDSEHYRDLGWQPVSEDTPTTVEAERRQEADAFLGVVAFDPGEHNVEDVLAYLESADEGERARVLQAERDGKARKTVVEAAE